jgi:serine/threonine-protein kinase RsbW
MKKDYREISISGKQDLYKLERFVEEICDYHNINNEYFGNILLASTEAASILISVSKNKTESTIVITFEKTIKGFTFKLKFSNDIIDEESENFLESEIRKHKLAKEIYIVKALADEVTISVKGESITLTFYVSSMNYEKSLGRINKLKEYWIKKSNTVKKGNE